MCDKLRCMATVYLTRDSQILLLYRQGGRVVSQVWVGSAGGHFEPQELNDPRVCVLRELQEELGLTESDLSGLYLRYITLRQTVGEIRQNYYFFAELAPQVTWPLISTEGQLQWFDLQQLPTLEMPLSAKNMLNHYLSEGRYTDVLYVGAAQSNRMEFVQLDET